MSKRRERIPIPGQFPSQGSHSPVSSITGSPFTNTPISTSPPSLSGFLSKPSRWFSRPSAASKNGLSSPETPRARTMSTVRRVAISGPTDPRPINSPNSLKPIEGSISASRSVLDLTLAPSADHTSPNDKSFQSGPVALKSISRKTWSRSVDDLSQIMSTQDQHSVLTDPPSRDESLNIQTRAKIEAYRRNFVNSPLAAVPSSQTAPSSPITPSDKSNVNNSSVTFPPILHPSSKSTPSTSIFSENSQPPRSRNRTMSSFDHERDRDKNRLIPPPATMPRLQGHSLTTSPTKHNPFTLNTSSDATSKRSSQIIQYSGFLNRHTGSNGHLTFRPAHLNIVLSKSWKPYKAVLKGSKLHFYKPPSDKNLEIRELFPQGTDPAPSELLQMIEPPEEEPEEPVQSAGKNKDEVRKRARLYRGRNTHPELSLGTDGFPARGTLDALLHETIFGNCFGTIDDRSTCRRRYSSCMMLGLPRLMYREEFENEFIRYATYFVNEAEVHEQDGARKHVSWLLDVYVAFYKHPFNATKWEQFKSSIKYMAGSGGSDENLTSSSSHKVHTESLLNRQPTDTKSVIGNLTDEQFLNFNPSMLAESLTLFHLQSLPQTCDTSLSVDFLEYALQNDGDTQSPGFYSAFFSSDEAPHWLSRFIVAQILSPYTISSNTSSDVPSISKTHLRSELVTHWIKTAEHCRGSGDRCTWKAVEAALCSRPLARLEKVWRRTDLSPLRLLHSWTKDLDTQDTPIMTPWGGDIRDRIASLWPTAKTDFGGRDDMWDVETLLKISDYVSSVQDQFARSISKLDFGRPDDITMQLVKLWRNVRTTPGKFRTFDDYMSLSFAAEPRLKGRFEAHHWQRTSNTRLLNAAAAQFLIPLAFIEPLPTFSLVDRELQRSKRDPTDVSLPPVHRARISQLFCAISLPGGDQQLDAALHNTSDGGGLVIPLYDGDLLVEVLENSLEIPSRPSSIFESNLERRTSQVRVTNGGFERKASVARRGSLPVLPQADIAHPAEKSSEPSLRVIIKAGTLDRLVDVLLFGLDDVSVSVADDNGEAPLRGGKTRLLKLDYEAFRTAWWATFRSFVTPLVFFELLRKRSTLSIPSHKTQRAIFLLILHWFEKGGGITDALNDSELFRTVDAFVNSPIAERDDKKSLDSTSLEALEASRQQVAELFTKRLRRPQVYTPLLSQTFTDIYPVNYGNQPPSLDELDPETLVENLDALAATAMRSLTLDDLIITIDILETQSADRLGWFLNQDAISNSDEIEIQTIYSHLQQVEPSVLISDTQDSIYKLLPPGIRGLILAHAVTRKYLLSKIVTPRLGLRIRQARMEMLLRAIEVCRLRTMDRPSDEMFINQSSACSFVETAIVSAIIAPESRFFSMAWNSVALSRGTTAESLDSLLAKPVTQSVLNNNRLTVDIGWLLERFLEVISMPNLVDSDVQGSTLINIDKRRCLYDLSVLSLSLLPSRTRKVQNAFDRSDVERLNNMHREVTGPAFDNRLLRDEAYHESLNGPAHHKRNQRPFAKIVQQQQEKYRRDRVVRDRLAREKKAEQIRSDKREEDLNRAMHSVRPNGLTLKTQRSRRTMSSAFLQLMRPISSAFISGDQSDNGIAPVQRRTAQELDFEPLGKPSLVISLAGATFKSFVNNIRLYLFYITTEDGGRYLLQASTRSELESWKSYITETAKLTSAKRLTYIGNSTKPLLPQDHIDIPSQMGSRHPQAVFNVDLGVLLQREAGNNLVPVGAVPHILERCLAEIEARGLQEPGLYRVPGASSSINALRAQFDTGRDYVDIFAICDVVKTWLRVLPQSIFPERSYQEAIQVIRMWFYQIVVVIGIFPRLKSALDFEERLKAVRKVIQGLPVNNMHLLKRVCEHLDRVTDYEEQNQMTAEALAVVFNPSLLRPPTNSFALLMQNMKYTSQLLQMLIIHFHRVFNVEQDEEADIDMADRIEDAITETELRPLSSVPTDVIHDHDPDLEPLPSRVGDGDTMMIFS
ncbi:hypothetical protein Clacol_002609 [Clathrus columnatus]|uniref:Uncharacterized protein n=1 Tax=Clathrus columnatus TaxID=1419009 RepID=A0AAV5A6M8_9AGAM|nr:hypothetical protein Clacol_002609 [Clathrus columnatus]